MVPCSSLWHGAGAERCLCRVLSRLLTRGEGALTHVWPACPTWAILVYNGGDDQHVGQESYPIKERLMFRGARGQAQGRTIEGIDKEGNREEQEKAVAGVAPEAQEKECRHEGGHGNRAQDQGRHVRTSLRIPDQSV